MLFAAFFHSLSQSFLQPLGQSFRSSFFTSFVFSRFDGVFPVSVCFQAVFVGIVFLFGELGDFGGFEELGEDTFLEGFGACHEPGKVSQHEQPLFEHPVQFVFRLIEFGHFQVDEGELVVEDIFCPSVHELDFVVEIVVVRLVEREVEYTDDVDGLQLIIPFAFLSLLSDGEGGVVDASVLEEPLFSPLHFDQEFFSFFILAIDVEYGFPVGFSRPEVFRVEVSQVRDHFFSAKQTVDEADEQVLVHLGAEQFLESEVCVRVDVSVFEFPKFHEVVLFMGDVTKIRNSFA